MIHQTMRPTQKLAQPISSLLTTIIGLYGELPYNGSDWLCFGDHSLYGDLQCVHTRGIKVKDVTMVTRANGHHFWLLPCSHKLMIWISNHPCPVSQIEFLILHSIVCTLNVI